MTSADERGLAVGLRATVRAVVGQSDTAIAMGSGDVPVLATPRLLALAEAASVAAVAPQLARGQTSVGTEAQLEHRRACPLGAELSVEAELTEIEGSRLAFVFIARRAPAASGQPDPAAPGGSDPSGSDLGSTDAGGHGGPGGSGGADGEDLVVGAGTLRRVVLDRDRFLARLPGSAAGRW